jgi:hypothetical protein
VDKLDDHIDYAVGPYVVTGLRKFLPAGPIRDPVTKKRTGRERRFTLLQLWTDGGMRTVSVASVWGQDPGKSDRPWPR